MATSAPVHLPIASRPHVSAVPPAPPATVESAPVTAPEPSEAARPGKLSPRERRIATALAEAAMPGGGLLPGGDGATVERLQIFLGQMGESFTRAFQGGLWTAEGSTVPTRGRTFSALPLDVRTAELERWSESRSRHLRWLLRAILTPIKSAHFTHPSLFEHVGCEYGKETPKQIERPRWMDKVTNGAEVTEDLELECEVVVVGTGAGGAAAAYELSRRGRAVLMLEAGEYHTRKSFDGHASAAWTRFYLGRGTTFAVGNIAAGVWAGRGVGGSTTINSGTCYRAPEHTLKRWGDRYGLSMYSADALAPYYDRVEDMLGVAPAPRDLLGGVARVVARGADRMGLSHEPLRRNAPGCDGQGVCCFGCPTGAKRSTDVSYVPEALKRGAELVTGAEVLTVDIEGGRARGVTARLASGKILRVRASAVITAGGALLTPLLLRRSGACTTSGWLGKNLSIHPASKVMALFGETIDMSRGIPQSYAIDEYQREGLMFEGASLPLDITAMGVPWVGPRFMDLMGRFPNLATFGFMIQDHARGEVHAGPGHVPIIRYDMSPGDVKRMAKGFSILCELFLRAGAERVMPMVVGCDEIRTLGDLERLRRLDLRAGDFEVTAYHPLGTCRMGVDPARSCIGPDGEAHDTEGLFVADGSAMPSSLGVNPQITIMAMALRIAEATDARLDDLGRSAPASGRQERAPAAAPSEGTGFLFKETMSGTCKLAGDADRSRKIVFTVTARSARMGEFLRRRVVNIEGTIDVEGLATAQPLSGTLGMDVILTRRIPYDFSFSGDDGRRYRFAGEKTVRALSLLQSMSRLPAALLGEGGEAVAEAELWFDLKGDLVSFLKSFELAAAGAA
jgi:choline dehydrogenase-like flavoprotein